MSACTAVFGSPSCGLSVYTNSSVGFAQSSFTSLVQTIITAYCAISPPSLWPSDYGDQLEAWRRMSDCSRHGKSRKKCTFVVPEKFDFIVVGAGAVGSIVAGRLAENPNVKVLVIEAGGNPPLESEIVGTWTLQLQTIVDWQFHQKSLLGCGHSNGTCHTPRGKMLGGSTAMTAMMYVRGNSRDYDQLSNYGIECWSWQDVLPYFKRYEGNENATIVAIDNGAYHNTTGPILVSSPPQPLGANMFINASKERGATYILDINTSLQPLGVVDVQSTSSGGRRSNSAKAYLSAEKNQPNLRVIKHAFVSKILLDGSGAAIGVRFKRHGKKYEAFANKEVILSAGSIMSPVVLQNSGIGPSDVLAANKIRPRVILPGVGNNFKDHVCITLTIKLNPMTLPPSGPFDEFYYYATNDSGSLTTAIYQSNFVDILSGTGFPDTQYIPVYLPKGNTVFLTALYTLFSIPVDVVADAFEAIKTNDIFIVFLFYITPKSAGYVRMNGTICRKPIINSRFLEDPTDMATCKAALKEFLSYMNTTAFKAQNAQFMQLAAPCGPVDVNNPTDEFLECYVKYFTSVGCHQTGSCRMGSASDPLAVVDSRLNVKNVPRLRVIDASIMPNPPSGNSAAMSFMIGEKGAQIVKEDYGWAPKMQCYS